MESQSLHLKCTMDGLPLHLKCTVEGLYLHLRCTMEGPWLMKNKVLEQLAKTQRQQQLNLGWVLSDYNFPAPQHHPPKLKLH